MKFIMYLRTILATVKNRMFFKKMILTYILCTGIVFISFSFIISSSILNNYMESINKLNNKALLQSANTSSITLENLYNNFYTDALEDLDMIKLYYANEYSPDLSLSSSRIRNKLLNYSNLISSFYVINLRGGFICTNLDTYSDTDDFFDSDILNYLSDNSGSKDIFTIAPKELQYSLFMKDYDKKYISLIFRKFTKGFLVINLDYEKFSEMINYNSYNEDSQTLVLNKEGLVLADSNSELFGKQFSSHPLYQDLMEREASSGSFVSRSESRKVLVNYRKNEVFGTVFLTMTHYQLLNRNNTLLLNTIVYSVIAIVISLFLSLFGCWFLYKPINKLKEAVGNKDGNTKIDEFRYIATTFETIKNDFYLMQKSSKRYQLTNQIQILKELLTTGAAKTPSSEFKILSDELSKNSFVVITIYLDNFRKLMENTNENINLLKYSVENIFRELLPEQYRLVMTDCNSHMSGVVNFNNASALAIRTEGNSNPIYDPGVNEQQMRELKDALLQLQKLFYQYFTLRLTCTMGTVVNNLLDIQESYQNAKTTFFYQLNPEQEVVLTYKNLDLQEQEQQLFPYRAEKNILEAVKNGEESRLIVSLEDFFQSIYHHSYNQIILDLLTLHTSLERLEQKCSITHSQEDVNISIFSLQHENLYRLKHLYLERCRQSMKLFQEIGANNSKKQEIIDEIIASVHRNISNPSLSVDTIAEEVHLSNSYLRNIFKEYTGNTLSNYIIEKRLEQICILLRETDLSIQKIADQLGFNSKNYVFTFFKNYMGMTPNQYRKQNMEKNIELNP